MSSMLLVVAVSIAQAGLSVAMVLGAFRIIRGPRAQDRVLALDALYVNTMLLFITLGVRTGTVFFFEAALIIAVVGFVATVALAKFLMRGEVIE